MSEADAGVLEMVDLEALLAFEECECQFPHEVTVCSVEVVARFLVSCEGIDWLICNNAAYVKQSQIDARHTCASCKRLVNECWQLFKV